jgi:hypothetical protein
MIPDGRYTVVYPQGGYRTLRVKTVKNGGLAGRTIISYKDGTGYTGFGFLLASGAVGFWQRFRTTNSPERLQRIEKAVRAIVSDPKKCGLQFALLESRCCRCGLELTVPASLHAGMGPECAKKGRWTKADNQMAWEWAKERAA